MWQFLVRIIWLETKLYPISVELLLGPLFDNYLTYMRANCRRPCFHASLLQSIYAARSPARQPRRFWEKQRSSDGQQHTLQQTISHTKSRSFVSEIPWRWGTKLEERSSDAGCQPTEDLYLIPNDVSGQNGKEIVFCWDILKTSHPHTLV